MAKATKKQNRLNLDFSDEQKDFLEREKQRTGVGQADLLKRLLDDYMAEPPLVRAIRRDKSLTTDDRIDLWELSLKRERARKRKR